MPGRDPQAGAVERERVADDAELLQDLLIKTSRTFALAIPLLPEPTVREVTVAYLLFRIADTFEDASVLWDRPRQLEALAGFADLLRAPTAGRARDLARGWLEQPPSEHEGYLELLEKTPEVLEAYLSLSPPARREIGRHTIRTTELMAAFVRRTDERGVLQLDTVPALRDYCYAVAGIVGEMLTELFLLGRSELEPVAGHLRERAARFGEGLQLVNILKDSASDATEGRNYLPAGVDRRPIFDLARGDLEAAAEYVLAIQRAGGPKSVVAFTALPVELARASLDRIESEGPGSKITRDEVFSLYDRVQRALAEDRPALELRSG